MYPNFAQNYQDEDWIMSRALLAPLNKTADALNEYITEKLPEAEQERLYPSADTVTDPETANLYPWNSSTPSIPRAFPSCTSSQARHAHHPASGPSRRTGVCATAPVSSVGRLKFTMELKTRNALN